MTALASPVRIVVVGAAGRMGRSLIKAVSENPACVMHAAIEREDSAAIGQDSGLLAGVSANGIPVTSDALEAFIAAHVVLDFTTPAATLKFAELSAQARLVHIIGTTGMSAEDDARLKSAARHAVIIKSGNFSLGVNMLAALVKRAAAALQEGWDIEIVEMHHRMKVDAPSGTALLLGEAAAAGREIALSNHAERGRDGHTGARGEGAIGFAALRGGSVIGDHTVILAGNGERLELRHIAEDRGLFAQGAVKAALWGLGRKPGYFDMSDVLGIKE